MWELETQPRSPFCLVSLGDPRHLPMASVSQPQRGSQAAPSSVGRGTRAVEVLRKGSSQEELSKGVAELGPEALRAGITGCGPRAWGFPGRNAGCGGGIWG